MLPLVHQWSFTFAPPDWTPNKQLTRVSHRELLLSVRMCYKLTRISLPIPLDPSNYNPRLGVFDAQERYYRHRCFCRWHRGTQDTCWRVATRFRCVRIHCPTHGARYTWNS